MTTRRKVLFGLGGVLVAGAAAGTWRVTRGPQTARAPWAGLDQPVADPRLDAFRHAILAPNPHNRQPWLIQLVGSDQAVLTCDLAKRLPITDPFDRQITIGFGTFIELARIAAAQRGFVIEVTPFPEGAPEPRLDRRPVAQLRFFEQPGLARDPLYAQIAMRRSNKESYDLSRKVDPAALASITAADALGTIEPSRIAALRAIVLDSIRIEQHDQAANMESVELMRIGAAEVDAQPDGIDLSGPLLETLAMAGMLDRAGMADPASTAFKSGEDMLKDTYGSIPAALWIVTPGNSRADQLEAGRRYVRTNLRATAAGLAIHPMSQSLQEYQALAAQFAAIHRLLGASGEQRVQMLARIGYGPKVDPAPRWPLETHVRA